MQPLATIVRVFENVYYHKAFQPHQFLEIAEEHMQGTSSLFVQAGRLAVRAEETIEAVYFSAGKKAWMPKRQKLEAVVWSLQECVRVASENSSPEIPSEDAVESLRMFIAMTNGLASGDQAVPESTYDQIRAELDSLREDIENSVASESMKSALRFNHRRVLVILSGDPVDSNELINAMSALMGLLGIAARNAQQPETRYKFMNWFIKFAGIFVLEQTLGLGLDWAADGIMDAIEPAIINAPDADIVVLPNSEQA